MQAFDDDEIDKKTIEGNMGEQEDKNHIEKIKDMVFKILIETSESI